jgi:hypothetical protein
MSITDKQIRANQQNAAPKLCRFHRGNPKKKMLNIIKRTHFPAFSGEF